MCNELSIRKEYKVKNILFSKPLYNRTDRNIISFQMIAENSDVISEMFGSSFPENTLFDIYLCKNLKENKYYLRGYAFNDFDNMHVDEYIITCTEKQLEDMKTLAEKSIWKTD